MVHLHHARSRHFDLRLQVGNTLRSWAVPKGPAARSEVRRLSCTLFVSSGYACEFPK
ncbi:MAG: DNA polymerase ligase N-terminal domain-containing protein [Steroidobacteraceae bacterium]